MLRYLLAGFQGGWVIFCLLSSVLARVRARVMAPAMGMELGIGLLFLAPAQASMPPPAPAALPPCAGGAPWRLVREVALPRRDSGGNPLGGFSAALYQAPQDRLWLLADLPQGSLSTWGGLATGGALEPLARRPLRRGAATPLPEAIDGEAMVLLADQLWVASEGRRTAERPAQLLRFEAASGTLLEALPLPPAWRPGPRRGLASNGGPEALAPLPGPRPRLLMAAELPLLQDPPHQVRLLLWEWPAGRDPRRDPPLARGQGALLLPPEGNWGLTDLLALPSGPLLALLRRFELPNRWFNQLALYPLPGANQVAAPLAVWDLQALGLTPENWEGISPGPRLADGRSSLVLVSDDNLNPLQSSRVALLTPPSPFPCRPLR